MLLDFVFHSHAGVVGTDTVGEKDIRLLVLQGCWAWIHVLVRCYGLKHAEQLIFVVVVSWGEMLSGTTDLSISFSLAMMCLTR